MATTFHMWSLLPTELKLEVLSYCVPQGKTIDAFDHDYYFSKSYIHRASQPMSMRMVIATRNREITALSLEIYYTTNHFRVPFMGKFSAGCRPTHPPSAYGSMVRHLHIKTVSSLTGNSVTPQDSCWYSLLQPLETMTPEQDMGKYGAWQAHFSKLRTLTLIVRINVGYPPEPQACRKCGFELTRLEELRQVLATMQLRLKADEIAVTVVNACASYLPKLGSCECIRPVEEKLAKMARREQ